MCVYNYNYIYMAFPLFRSLYASPIISSVFTRVSISLCLKPGYRRLILGILRIEYLINQIVTDWQHFIGPSNICQSNQTLNWPPPDLLIYTSAHSFFNAANQDSNFLCDYEFFFHPFKATLLKVKMFILEVCIFWHPCFLFNQFAED